MTPTPAPAWTPCSACWAVRKLATPATHASQYSDLMNWCPEHALPGDPPLGETDDGPTEAMLERAFRIPRERPR